MTTSAQNKLAEQVENLDLKSPEELYSYTVESMINGQRKQARELYNELPKEAQAECFKHIWRNYPAEQYEAFLELITYS